MCGDWTGPPVATLTSAQISWLLIGQHPWVLASDWLTYELIMHVVDVTRCLRCLRCLPMTPELAVMDNETTSAVIDCPTLVGCWPLCPDFPLVNPRRATKVVLTRNSDLLILTGPKTLSTITVQNFTTYWLAGPLQLDAALQCVHPTQLTLPLRCQKRCSFRPLWPLTAITAEYTGHAALVGSERSRKWNGWEAEADTGTVLVLESSSFYPGPPP